MCVCASLAFVLLLGSVAYVIGCVYIGEINIGMMFALCSLYLSALCVCVCVLFSLGDSVCFLFNLVVGIRHDIHRHFDRFLLLSYFFFKILSFKFFFWRKCRTRRRPDRLDVISVFFEDTQSRTVLY